MQGQAQGLPARLAAAAAGALAALALIAALPAGAVAVPANAGSCRSDVAVDFEAPIRALPAVPAVPADRQLPFGPGNAFLHPRAQTLGLLLSGGDDGAPRKPKPGFVLAFPSQSGHGPGARLGWTVTAKLARIGADGTVGRPLAAKRRRVGRARGSVPFFLPAPERRAMYRVQIVFRNRKGRVLGRYAEYFRVLPEVTDVRMSLNATGFTAGETIEACLENFGTTAIVYGVCGFRAEHLVDTVWMPASFASSKSCPAIGITLPPGATAPAGAEAIPADAEAGRYRAVFEGASAEFQIWS